MSCLILEINDSLALTADERSRAVLIRRLQRALKNGADRSDGVPPRARR